MDVTQTITELVNAGNIAIEKHINKICYRDLFNYYQARNEEKSSVKWERIFNDYKDKNYHFPINVDTLENNFTQYYDCYSDNHAVDTSIDRSSDCEELTVG